MNSIIGIVLTLICVFGGYMMAGGKLEIILHALPFEMMMIGGAAIGAFVCGNDMHGVKSTLGDIVAVFKGPKWKRQDYADLLCLMHELIRLTEESPVDLEAHIEDPENSSLFQKYPRILASSDFVELICDTLRSMLMNFDNVYQVEELLDKQLETMKEERMHGSHALQSMADALPALGIVAAVLGVIKTMASIDKPPEVLGQMIGGALVGTFLGVFLAYALVGPLATRVAQIREQEAFFYGLMREVLVSRLHKNDANLCIEVARRSAPHGSRPSFTEVEDAIKALKQAA
ncbi:flagellar motor stator protein MotA [Algimonas porphyrae]|uniref:Flagellar motor protein MotA n=1 Tax=Algimonas porphyrae TaxID=1128113 RepID=A0ABQ5V432_9PROT|nr:flagellar motor stator protein MotA [Algimonas porphyrae]GLQ21440.1 flagellar motor protein MotA [Algimonas porphyrae]